MKYGTVDRGILSTKLKLGIFFIGFTVIWDTFPISFSHEKTRRFRSSFSIGTRPCIIRAQEYKDKDNLFANQTSYFVTSYFVQNNLLVKNLWSVLNILFWFNNNGFQSFKSVSILKLVSFERTRPTTILDALLSQES